MTDEHEDRFIEKIDYRDERGKLIWSEPMRFERLWGVGDILVEKGISYRVQRTAIADGVQHVNVKKDGY